MYKNMPKAIKKSVKKAQKKAKKKNKKKKEWLKLKSLKNLKLRRNQQRRLRWISLSLRG